MKKLTQFFKHSYVEMLRHVTWSTYSELQQSSVLVLIASVVFALVIGLIDFLFNGALEAFYYSF